MQQELLQILESLSRRSRIYLSLRYGLNPWAIQMRHGEIAEFLEITPESLNILRERLMVTLSSSRSHKAFQGFFNRKLTHPTIASHKRRNEVKRLRQLSRRP